MSRLTSWFADGFWSGAAGLGRLHPLARPERHGVEVLRDRRYRAGTSSEQMLDVYRPIERTGPLPAVLYIHGGGFLILSKDTHWLMGLAFARHGAVVFNVNYRLAPGHHFPAAQEDIAAAYQWVVAHASEYGADPARLVVAGESAGANLAAFATFASVYERDEPYARAIFETGIVPVAALPACGIFQVSDVERLARRKAHLSSMTLGSLEGVERACFGSAGPRAIGPSIDLVDVVSWLERREVPTRAIPPFLLTVGTRDPLLPDTRRMAAALRALDVTCVDRYYVGGIHSFHAFVFQERARACWRDHFAFFDQHVPS